jgi:hypothetical protein
MALKASEVRPARCKASAFSASQYGTPNWTELVAGKSPVRFLARRYLSETPFAWSGIAKTNDSRAGDRSLSCKIGEAFAWLALDLISFVIRLSDTGFEVC